MNRRELRVDEDGMAEVLLLGDPIPRHLSIVSWGANDRPAQSWKNARPPSEILRSPPTVINVGDLSMQRVQSFIAETLDAWGDTVNDVLATPLSAADRGARIRALTSQAGARIAAFAIAAQPRLAAATKTYKTVSLELPEPPSASTLQGELDRRRFSAGVQQASGVLTDRVLSAMRDGSDGSISELILREFGMAGEMFSRWAASMPDGVVGVGGQPPEESQKAGARHSKTDSYKLNQIKELLGELLGEGTAQNPDITENGMTITIDDLRRLATSDPVSFLNTISTAVKSAKENGVDVSQKYMWGETGVTPYTVEDVMGPLRDMVDGGQLAGLIASAVSGVDLSSAASGDSPQVAATMRSAFAKMVKHEIETNPQGDLAQSVKSLVAPSVAEAIKSCMEAVLNGQSEDPAGGGMFDFEEDDVDLSPQMPSFR